MTIDRYAKTVLTIIAAALVWLCIIHTPIGTPLGAQAPIVSFPDTMRVVIAGWEGSGPRVQGNAAPSAIMTFTDLRAHPLPTETGR